MLISQGVFFLIILPIIMRSIGMARGDLVRMIKDRMIRGGEGKGENRLLTFYGMR